jgi:signal transduction histidine kinase/ActR/RegA family two-component response regulator
MSPVTDFVQRLTSRGAGTSHWRLLRGTLFWKYATLFVLVVSSALVANSLVETWFTYQEQQAALVRLQKEQAASAAAKITQFVKEIESQLGWTTHLSWTDPAMEQRELDATRLLRQVPAITELSLLDDKGREQLRMSRQAMDRVGGNADFSADDKFKLALANKVYYGPVYFRRDSEPFMTLSVAGTRRDSGVSAAEVNLTHIWDVVHQIRVGRTGRAYVVDGRGRLIAHPDISLVLRNTDLSKLAQVQAAWADSDAPEPDHALLTDDVYGKRVLTAYAKAAPLDWLVFVELPQDEADEPLYESLFRSAVILMAGLLVALLAGVFLARQMVFPIRTLSAGAARIGAGVLDHRITIKTGDELEELGTQLNHMAAQLQGSYATLERKVEERTNQLQAANLSKSRFLAAASHDLRQPLHALNLFVAQLRAEKSQAERDRLAARIDAAVGNMNELFSALLDISKLDAGAVKAGISEFPITNLLSHIESTFVAAAREKDLILKVMPSSAWVRSDPILLERILLNLVSNAVRYTPSGRILVGCRHVGGLLRIEVCDTGIGIPKEQYRDIFSEFYQIERIEGVHPDGLGLGLSIVERLCVLLDHPIGFVSTVGQGSRFHVLIPKVPERFQAGAPSAEDTAMIDPLRGKLIVVIDDDALVLEGTGGLLESWGCRVMATQSDADALAELKGERPDLIISDFRLNNGRTGIEAIAQMRSAFKADIPAFLVSGDILPDRIREAQANGHHLLHKPLNPMTLRNIMSALLRGRPGPADPNPSRP